MSRLTHSTSGSGEQPEFRLRDTGMCVRVSRVHPLPLGSSCMWALELHRLHDKLAAARAHRGKQYYVVNYNKRPAAGGLGSGRSAPATCRPAYGIVQYSTGLYLLQIQIQNTNRMAPPRVTCG